MLSRPTGRHSGGISLSLKAVERDEFAFRPLRAGVFVAMGLSAVVPAAHLFVVDGFDFLYKKVSSPKVILLFKASNCVCSRLLWCGCCSWLRCIWEEQRSTLPGYQSDGFREDVIYG